MEAPCKFCNKRGCGSYHDKCEPYLEFRKERESISRIHEEKEKRSVPQRKYKRSGRTPIRCHKK